MQNKKPFFTSSVIRTATWNAIFILLLYVLLNVFFIIILKNESARILDNHLDHEIEHFMNAMHMEGDSLIIDNPKELSESDLITVSPTSFFLQVYRPSQELLIQSKNLQEFDEIPVLVPEKIDGHRFSNLQLKDYSLRVVYTYLKDEKGIPKAIMQLAGQKVALSEFMPTLVTYSLISFPIIFFLIVVGSILLAKKSFRPINKIIGLANSISATELNKRLDYNASPNDELGRLRDTLNELFDRLQQQIEKISQFTDNASHQLLSPLTVLKSELEFILRKTHENSDCREAFEVMSEQTDRMIKIVQTLLVLAKECNSCYSERSVINLSTLILAMKKVFPQQNLALQIESGLYVRGNGDYFKMVMYNLIDNAVKYSKNGYPVIVRAKLENKKVIITVCDNGIGIPENLREKIFERFFRDENGTKESPSGFGLGLALAKQIISSMNGSIEVQDNIPNGSCFIISLDALSVE